MLSQNPMEISRSPSRIDDVEVQDAKLVTVYDIQGYSIYVGRNARSNEALVSEHKRDHPHCLWFHALGQKGPHVVLCVENVNKPQDAPVDPMVLRCAAAKALKFTNATTKKVVYAPLEDVYKPEKGQQGIYRTWRTTVIEL